jgi:hypothetical protein
MPLRFWSILLVPALAFMGSTNARGQNVPLTGKIASASSPSIASGGSATVYTTPTASKGHFVLTQVCSHQAGVVVSGRTFGLIASTIQATGSTNPCVSLSPGYALPASEVISCQNVNQNANECSISGVIETK